MLCFNAQLKVSSDKTLCRFTLSKSLTFNCSPTSKLHQASAFGCFNGDLLHMGAGTRVECIYVCARARERAPGSVGRAGGALLNQY